MREYSTPVYSHTHTQTHIRTHAHTRMHVQTMYFMFCLSVCPRVVVPLSPSYTLPLSWDTFDDSLTPGVKVLMLSSSGHQQETCLLPCCQATHHPPTPRVPPYPPTPHPYSPPLGVRPQHLHTTLSSHLHALGVLWC